MLNIDKFNEELQWDGRKPDCIQKILEKAEKKRKGDKSCLIRSGEYIGKEKEKEFATLKYHYEKVFRHDFVDGDIDIIKIPIRGGVLLPIETITCGGITPEGLLALKKLQSGNTNIWG